MMTSNRSTSISRIVFSTLLILLLAVCMGFASAETVAPYTGDLSIIANPTVSGINDAPANSSQHFTLCCSAEYPFTSLKGDVRITSDNKVIMYEHPGFTLNAENRIIAYNASSYTKIRDLTYDQVMQLRYADLYNGQEVGICDFDTFISICKQYGKKPYITLRTEYTAEILEYILPILEQHGMVDKATISNTSYDILQYARNWNGSIHLSYVVSKSSFTTTAVNNAKGLGNCVITLYDFPASRGGLGNYSAYYAGIIHAQQNGVALNAAILEQPILTDDLKSLGISGIQYSVNPAHEAHAWADPVYTWSADYKSLTASKTCQCGQNHTISETVGATVQVIEAATYDREGKGIYTSEAFKNPAFTVQEITVPIPAIPVIPYASTIQDNGNYGLNWTTYTATLKGIVTKNVIAFTIPDTIVVEGRTFKITEIGPSAFRGNKYLTYLAIGNNVTIIGANAFKSCANLRAVYGGAAVERVKSAAFYGCKKLRIFPRLDNLIAIGANAFRYDYYLREFFFGKRINYIGQQAFFKCKRLKTMVIETMALTGSTVKAAAFRGTVKKAVVQVPSQVLGYYKNLLPRKGINGKARISALPYVVTLEAQSSAKEAAAVAPVAPAVESTATAPETRVAAEASVAGDVAEALQDGAAEAEAVSAPADEEAGAEEADGSTPEDAESGADETGEDRFADAPESTPGEAPGVAIHAEKTAFIVDPAADEGLAEALILHSDAADTEGEFIWECSADEVNWSRVATEDPVTLTMSVSDLEGIMYFRLTVNGAVSNTVAVRVERYADEAEQGSEAGPDTGLDLGEVEEQPEGDEDPSAGDESMSLEDENQPAGDGPDSDTDNGLEAVYDEPAQDDNEISVIDSESVNGQTEAP